MSSASEPRESILERSIPFVAVGAIVVLVLLPLYFLAGTLVVRSGLLNYRGGNLDPKQFSAVWALIGALFASGVSLLGLLATYLHQKRTHRLTQQAEERLRVDSERTQLLAEEAERRLQLESVAKGLGLISEGGQYAAPARVAGGLATVVRLGQASVALTAMRAAWKDNRIDAETACWLTDRVIEEGNPSDIIRAGAYLFENSPSLVYPTPGGNLIITLPDALIDRWDPEWPRSAKVHFIGALAGAHMAVPPQAWKNGNMALLRSLLQATRDPDAHVATTASKILLAFAPDLDDFLPMFGTDAEAVRPDAEEESKRIGLLTSGKEFFPRTPEFVEKIARWRAGTQGRTLI